MNLTLAEESLLFKAFTHQITLWRTIGRSIGTPQGTAKLWTSLTKKGAVKSSRAGALESVFDGQYFNAELTDEGYIELRKLYEERTDRCPDCSGRGTCRQTACRMCPTCNGSGKPASKIPAWCAKPAETCGACGSTDGRGPGDDGLDRCNGCGMH
jgi:hypothetical protein